MMTGNSRWYLEPKLNDICSQETSFWWKGHNNRIWFKTEDDVMMELELYILNQNLMMKMSNLWVFYEKKILEMFDMLSAIDIWKRDKPRRYIVLIPSCIHVLCKHDNMNRDNNGLVGAYTRWPKFNLHKLKSGYI